MAFPKIIAHRGLPHVAPENTLASFKSALDLEIDGIETDVQATKDGQLILCHDNFLDRTTNGHGLIKDYTLKEIKSLSAGSWFSKDYAEEKIPTLEEFLELVKERNLIINLEIKSGNGYYPNIEQKLIEMVQYYKMTDRVTISSFNHYSLIICKEIDPTIKTGVLYECALVDPWDYAHKLKAEALHPYYTFVNSEMMAGTKLHSLMVNPYTIDSPEEMEYMISLGVDSIITNYPDRLIDIKNSRLKNPSNN